MPRTDHERSRPRLSALDGLRGLAACGVAFFFHYQHFGAPVVPFAEKAYWLHEYGNTLVEFFFVISGFVFSHVYRERIVSGAVSFKEFALLRLSRLYPLHLFTLLIVAALQPVHRAATGEYFIYDANDLYHFLLNVAFIQNGWLGTEYSFNAPSWSVSVELLAYVTFFVVLAFVKSRAAYLAVFGLIVIVGLRLSTAPIDPSLLNWQVGQVLLGFFVGCLVYELHRRVALAGRSTLLAIAAATALLLVVTIGVNRTHAAFGPQFHAVYSLAVWPLVILVVLNVGALAWLFSIRPAAYLGTLSYSIYLLHFPVQLAIATLDARLDLDIDFGTRTAFGGYVAAVLVVAVLSHHFVERPAKGWLRRLATEPVPREHTGEGRKLALEP